MDQYGAYDQQPYSGQHGGVQPSHQKHVRFDLQHEEGANATAGQRPVIQPSYGQSPNWNQINQQQPIGGQLPPGFPVSDNKGGPLPPGFTEMNARPGQGQLPSDWNSKVNPQSKFFIIRYPSTKYYIRSLWRI